TQRAVPTDITVAQHMGEVPYLCTCADTGGEVNVGALVNEHAGQFRPLPDVKSASHESIYPRSSTSCPRKDGPHPCHAQSAYSESPLLSRWKAGRPKAGSPALREFPDSL